MPVSELLERMSSSEISEWMAFSRLEPFGAEAEYVGHAITAATVANVNRRKEQKAFQYTDFIPRFEPEKKQSVDEMVQFAEMVTIGLGGKDLREDNDG